MVTKKSGNLIVHVTADSKPTNPDARHYAIDRKYNASEYKEGCWTLMDEIDGQTNTTGLPELIRGGTFYICRHDRVTETRVPKLDKNGRKTRYTQIVRKTTPRGCFRKIRINGDSGLAKIIRHIRKEHYT